MSTRVLLVSTVILLLILLTGPLGYKFGIVPLQPSLLSLLVALAGGILAVVIGLVYLVIAFRRSLPANRNMLILAMALGLVPAIIMVPQMMAASSVPPIHDITTDTSNPPAFDALKAVRANAPNGVDYGASEAWPAEKLATAQQEAYPDIQPVITALGVSEAIGRAEATLAEMGLEIIAVDEASGLIEATATTFWFGFKDDMVVRVVTDGEGAKIDLRSMSRVGQSDVGVNAARIAEFIRRF